MRKLLNSQSIIRRRLEFVRAFNSLETRPFLTLLNTHTISDDVVDDYARSC